MDTSQIPPEVVAVSKELLSKDKAKADDALLLLRFALSRKSTAAIPTRKL